MMDRVLIERNKLKAIKQALQDAFRELEAMEESHDWYTASPKMMTRIESAIDSCSEALIR